MVTGYKRIKILSEAEINDLYSLPKFTKVDKDSKRDHKWHLINPTIEGKDDNFFAGVPNINISELLYFINEQTNFCEAFDHIKPRYSKQKADYEGTIACIVANGFALVLIACREVVI